MDNKRAQRTKQKCGKFRILIIGRANAGKTTILKRVCDTTEEPEVYNKRGGKIDRSILAASAGRGEHDIENEMAFASNPDFCFHDSRGFESGGIDELDKVNAFITQRSQDRKLENRLHAIWYCIPMDDDRPFTAAETHFFSNIGTGCVPVIVVFTKFDALDDKAYDTLRKNNLSRSDARKEAPKHAVIEFEQRHLNSFYTKPYPPKRHVYLRDMNKEGTDCNELVRQTAGALDNEFLENLLVSTQRNNLELCIEYSFKRVVLPAMAEIVNKNSLLLFFQGTLTEKEITRKVVKMCAWFPQFVVSVRTVQRRTSQHSFFVSVLIAHEHTDGRL
ncbi:hypothetical protein M408DRAFT_334266 [Serendipita vermifera MAFF 305830]|uniref:G domain-containing protein n=1 Tax=Serendipita vermifera MAFF 305830 TaxID=933852 RepID=A0A0C3AI79_SERVB|nr:hypothetical protein M408DRAFT_334266 [Serendipita vermifera MAFF 305830]